MAIVVLERLTPGAIYGVQLVSFHDALDLWAWAHSNPDYVCRLYDKTDGTWEVQVEGPTTGTAVATEGQWIVMDGKEFLTFSQAEFDNLYRIKP